MKLSTLLTSIHMPTFTKEVPKYVMNPISIAITSVLGVALVLLAVFSFYVVSYMDTDTIRSIRAYETQQVIAAKQLLSSSSTPLIKQNDVVFTIAETMDIINHGQ